MKKAIIIFISIIFFSSCSTLVDDLNNNPNSPTNASYQYILTGAELGNTILHSGEATRKTGIFCGYYTGLDRNHLGLSEYAVNTSNFNTQWNDVYVKTLVNAIATETAAEEEGITGVTIGITHILKAMALGTATSLWEDIPFDEAGYPEIENPVFEDQLIIYGKLQSMLDDAIIKLASGTGRPASGSDIHFDGNPVKWTEVAYTLKARYYMHVKDYANAYQAALKGISSFENNLKTPHGMASENSNLNYQFFAIAVRQSDLVTSDLMTSLIAPDALLSPDFSRYRGNDKTDETSRYNYLFHITEFGTQPNTVNGFAAQDEPTHMITFRENLLILAEAGFRTVGFETGLTQLNVYRAFLASGGYFSNGGSNFKYDGYEATDFETGGIENIDGLPLNDALLREILEERYISFFGQIEGFNDTRRTINETTVRVPVMPNTGEQLPQRFLYPTIEIDRNSNVPNPVPDFFSPTKVNQ
jgi:hypothetical protein